MRQIYFQALFGLYPANGETVCGETSRLGGTTAALECGTGKDRGDRGTS